MAEQVSTLAVAVRSLLIDGISTLPALADVGVTFGYKVNSKKRERIWTQSATFEQGPASMRATRTFRDENGAFQLVVLVEGINRDAEWTAGRAKDLATEVSDWVAVHANWNTAIAGLTKVTVQGGGSLTEYFNDKGTLAELVLPIAYHARIE